MEDSQERYVNSPDGLNLRASAGGSVQSTLAHGMHLKTIGQPTAPDAAGTCWQQVQAANGQIGWVAAHYLSLANPLAPVDVSEPQVAAHFVYVNSADGLNLRADKDSTAQVLVTLANGQRLHSQDVRFGPDARGLMWLEVKTDDGQAGWVAAEYVTDQEPAPAGSAAAHSSAALETE